MKDTNLSEVCSGLFATFAGIFCGSWTNDGGQLPELTTSQLGARPNERNHSRCFSVSLAQFRFATFPKCGSSSGVSRQEHRGAFRPFAKHLKQMSRGSLKYVCCLPYKALTASLSVSKNVCGVVKSDGLEISDRFVVTYDVVRSCR